MNENLLKAMSAYLTEELDKPVTVDSYEEINATICDTGCWEEIRVFMEGRDAEGNYISEQYSGEMSDFIQELEKYSDIE